MIGESPLTRYSLLNLLYREACYREQAARDQAAGGNLATDKYLPERNRRVRILEALAGSRVESILPT